MTFGEHLQQTQPIAFRTITNGFVRHSPSHAYLLIGDSGTPLLETAQWIAQSLVCEHPIPTACEHCLSCERVLRGTYMDVIVIDGSKESIKKEQLENLQLEFSKSSIENSGKRVYILHHFDKTSPQAMNSILKFLEEPTPDIVAILTTTNPSRLLPTILSRCQNIRLVGQQTHALIASAVEQGVTLEDAHILANRMSTVELIVEAASDITYQELKSIVVEWFTTWAETPDLCIYQMQLSLQTHAFDRQNYALLLEIAEFGFKNRLKLEQGEPVVWETLAAILAKPATMHPEKWLALILKAKGELLSNGNGPMIMDGLLYRGYHG